MICDLCDNEFNPPAGLVGTFCHRCAAAKLQHLTRESVAVMGGIIEALNIRRPDCPLEAIQRLIAQRDSATAKLEETERQYGLLRAENKRAEDVIHKLNGWIAEAKPLLEQGGKMRTAVTASKLCGAHIGVEQKYCPVCELGRALKQVGIAEQERDDWREVLRRIDALFGCRHTAQSAEDADNLVKHVAEALEKISILTDEKERAFAACAEFRSLLREVADLDTGEQDSISRTCRLALDKENIGAGWLPPQAAERYRQTIHDREKRELEAAAEADKFKAALTRIHTFPVHSEPVGGALAMQDIAEEALK